MPLESFAYAIREDLVKGQPLFDVPVLLLAHQTAGMTHVDPYEYAALSPEQKDDYWRRTREAEAKAIAEGILIFPLYEWRNADVLHSWMERLYRNRGGQEYPFQSISLRLFKEDLERLHQELVVKLDDRRLADEIDDFIFKALQAIKDGMAVYYDSWL